MRFKRLLVIVWSSLVQDVLRVLRNLGLNTVLVAVPVFLAVVHLNSKGSGM
jgi:hypothetical protein